MATQQHTGSAVFKVLDALDAPYTGRILKLRLQEGAPPALRQLRGAQLKARSPKGEEKTLRVLGFYLAGGKPSDKRFSRTGRVELVVSEEQGNGSPISALWTVTGPV